MPDSQNPTGADRPGHNEWIIDRFHVWLRPHAPRQRGEPGARAVLGPALGQSPDALPIRRDERGKPHLDAAAGEQAVSWSHSGHALLVAMGRARELGVDVEQHRERPRMMEIAQRFFHPSELDWLRAQPDERRSHAFVRLWCIKEAVLKAHGQGVSFGLEKLVFGERDDALHLIECAPGLGHPDQWRLHEWAPAPGYRGALAWRD